MSRIPLIIYFTSSHRIYYERYFRPSFERHLSRDFELRIVQDAQQGSGSFYDSGWTETMARKISTVEQQLTTMPEGCIALFSDVDIIFFNNIRTEIETALAGNALFAFQADKNEFCAGFFAMKNCESTRRTLRQTAANCYDDDQRAINRQIRLHNIPVVTLPEQFSSIWRITGGIWRGGWFRLPDTRSLRTFHANFTVGKPLKMMLLEVFRHADGPAPHRLYAGLIRGAAVCFFALPYKAGRLVVRWRKRLVRLLFRLALLKPFAARPDRGTGSRRAQYLRQRDPVQTEQQVSNAMRTEHLPAGVRYLDLPLAALVERNLLQQVRIRRATKTVTRSFSVCQHIHYRLAVPILAAAGVGTMFTPHCDGRSSDLELLPIPMVPAVKTDDSATKDILYSFVGCDHPKVLDEKGVWRPSMTRTRVLNIPRQSDTVILPRQGWHFNVRNSAHEEEYRNILARSRFALCPRGTGPGTIRFWEALAAGAIPVLFSDHLLLPVVDGINWHEAILWLDENDVESADRVIRAVTAAEESVRRRLCREIFRILVGPNQPVAVIRAWARGETRLFQGKTS